jgi:hypothetical protein
MGNVSLKIVLLYADRSSAELGKEVAESLRQKLGSTFRLRQSSWNVELLRSAKLRSLAAMEARDSDMVMVAMDEGIPLSPEIEDWFELWRDRKRSPGALVALLKRDEPDTPHVVEESLHAYADQAQMDFFCHSELRAGYPRVRINVPEPAAV